MKVPQLFSMTFIFGGLLAVSIFATPCAAEREADEAALQQRTAAFAEAVNSGEAKQVADFWTDEGEYASGDGVTIRGKVDLLQAYREHFKEVGIPKVTHEIDGIRFLSRDAAMVEGGFASKYPKEKEPKSAGSSILYVREDGVWKIAVLREWSRATTLCDLDWLIGDWTAKTEDGIVNTAYDWSDDKSVITMKFSIKGKEENTSGRQIIALDPATGGIRSWVFVGGGIGDGDWSREGDGWVIHSRGLSADGEAMTATNTLTPKGKDSFTFRSTDRTLNGEELPDVGPITVKRAK